MNENLKALIRAASEDDELMAQATALINELNGASDEHRDEIVARIVSLANERGYALTEEDLVVETPEEGEIEDEQLAVVAGGCCGSPSMCHYVADDDHGGMDCI